MAPVTSSIPLELACPDCRGALQPVGSRGTLAHRCGRCRGVWLDPEAFRRLCEEDEPGPDQETGLARAATTAPSPRGADVPVRYRACPVCRDVMSRTNFAKVSAVVLDVCRAHGAWFDRGELAAIRAFLRAGGARRFQRHQVLQGDLDRSRGAGSAGQSWIPPSDLYDVLVGGDVGTVLGKVPRLVLVTVFTALGAGALWLAFHPDSSTLESLGLGPVALAVGCFHFAWRALDQWLARRGL